MEQLITTLILLVLILLQENCQYNQVGGWVPLQGYAGNKIGSLKSGVTSRLQSARDYDIKGATFRAGRAIGRGGYKLSAIIFTVITTIVICAFVLPVGLIILIIIMSYKYIKLKWAYIKAL